MNETDQSQDFDAALDTFVGLWTVMIHDHFRKNLTNLPLPKLVLEHGSKYTRVMRQDYPDDPKRVTIKAFIARESFSNKGMGAVVKGQIFKPATWAAPAKHARGSIFGDNPMAGMGVYGPEYLR